MKAYELLFIVAPSTDEETRANTMNRIQGVITSAEGSVDNVDEWGKRKLAYEINGLTDEECTGTAQEVQAQRFLGHLRQKGRSETNCDYHDAPFL